MKLSLNLIECMALAGGLAFWVFAIAFFGGIIH